MTSTVRVDADGYGCITSRLLVMLSDNCTELCSYHHNVVVYCVIGIKLIMTPVSQKLVSYN